MPRARHLPRRTRVILGVCTTGVIVVLGVVSFAATRSDNSSSSSLTKLASNGPPAPAFSVPSVGDPSATVSLRDFKGTPVVMNFFGSWCAPCRGEMPLLAVAARSHPGIRFVGIDVEDTRAGARAMMAQYGVTYPAGFDPNDSVATKYGIRGTPTTVFIDAKGKVVKQYTGALTSPILQALLRQLPTS